MKDLVFWQHMLSMHQSALLRNLGKLANARIILVVEEEVLAGRKALGWGIPDFGGTQILVRPAPAVRSELLSRDPSHSLHIFSGPRGGGPTAWDAFRRAHASGLDVAIYSEAHRGGGAKGLLRYLRARYDALRFGGHVRFVLGIGSQGVRWFKKTGYPPERIFPFGYFVETPLPSPESSSEAPLTPGSFDLVFVGQLIARKGWDILLHALHRLADLNWRLHVAGDGKDREKFLTLGRKLGMSERVHFYCRLPNENALTLIRRSDLLVLPSRWDGWGAVVNEALMCGVPAVCSDRCGAADLLDGRERGESFRSGSITSLRSVLDRRIGRGKTDAAARERIRDWSRCLSGESAADYLVQIITASSVGGSRPTPPWSGQAGEPDREPGAHTGK